VDRTLGAIDIEGHALGRRSNSLVLHQGRVEANESLIVSRLGENLRFEPVQRRRERDADLPPFTRGQHPKRRVLGQPFRIIGVLVTGQAAIDGLAKEVRQGELRVVSRARISEVSFNQRAQAEALVQLARQ
jgi:hypothetical protein